MNIEEINKLDYVEFIQVLGSVVEHCPLVAATVWKYRPFQSVNQLHQHITEFLDGLPDVGKEGVLRLHPDLAGRLAQLGKLTQESKSEQTAGGLDTLSAGEQTFLEENNRKYKDKFGFPFIITVRQNKKDAIMAGIQQRLTNTPDEELKTGLEEVKKICFLRLLNIISEN